MQITEKGLYKSMLQLSSPEDAQVFYIALARPM